ncbi:hypothetical protein [Paenibacillus turpanensis]|nr:hypothetical protein [Paenibacillus turpanensis]
MKQILVTVMLLIVVASIYMTTVSGEQGAVKSVRDGGQKVSRSIEAINP